MTGRSPKYGEQPSTRPFRDGVRLWWVPTKSAWGQHSFSAVLCCAVLCCAVTGRSPTVAAVRACCHKTRLSGNQYVLEVCVSPPADLVDAPPSGVSTRRCIRRHGGAKPGGGPPQQRLVPTLIGSGPWPAKCHGPEASVPQHNCHECDVALVEVGSKGRGETLHHRRVPGKPQTYQQKIAPRPAARILGISILRTRSRTEPYEWTI